MSKHDCQTIRTLGYRSNISYYIQFDIDLNINHTRLYTLIEQMESNPNPKVIPTFSYGWFAHLIGVQVREAKRIAKLLKDKNYIFHAQQKDGTWLWGTVKEPIICEEGGVALEDTPGVASNDTGGVASNDTQNTTKINYHKEETTECENSESFIFDKFFDKTLLEQKLSIDKRSGKEFLEECLYHIENRSSKDKYSHSQRMHGILNLLKKLKNKNVIFLARGKKKEEDKLLDAGSFSLAAEENQLKADYLYAKKMEGWGVDINIFMPNLILRNKAQELLNKTQAMGRNKQCQARSNARRDCTTLVSNLVSHLR